MNKKLILAALTAATMMASWGANATLEPRLNGQAYYDTETDLTWTADMNPFGNQGINDHLASLSSFVIDGAGDWRIPTFYEFIDIVRKSSYCAYDIFCDPIGPFIPDHFSGWFYYLTPETEDRYKYFAPGSDGKYYAAFGPSISEAYPASLEGYSGFAFAAWPVHTGDVAAISQVPEPSTYAMLLAGLGLIGFIGRRKNAIKL